MGHQQNLLRFYAMDHYHIQWRGKIKRLWTCVDRFRLKFVAFNQALTYRYLCGKILYFLHCLQSWNALRKLKLYVHHSELLEPHTGAKRYVLPRTRYWTNFIRRTNVFYCSWKVRQRCPENLSWIRLLSKEITNRNSTQISLTWFIPLR